MKVINIFISWVPNLFSFARIFLIPLFIYLLFIPEIESRVWALIVFIFASFTDMLDGWSARKLNQETEFGKFLDPFADKVLVVSSLIALLFLDHFIPFWMIVIIVGRDMLITLMRYLAIKRGRSLRTSRFGKIKTAFQMVSIIIIIMIIMIRKKAVLPPDDSVLDVIMSTRPEKWLIVSPYLLMLVVTILTAVSGLRYIYTNISLFYPAKKNDGGEA